MVAPAAPARIYAVQEFVPTDIEFPPMHPLQSGSMVRLDITSMAVGGDGVSRIDGDGLVVFVEGGAPGDSADVELTEVHRHYARGRVRKVHVASADRVDPPCPIYDRCGGCHLQHLSDEAQLRLKSHIVREALRLGHLTDVPVRPCLPTRAWEYRSKMQLVAGFKQGPLLGLYERHSHRVVPLEHCLIAHPLANRVMAAASEAVARLGWEVYDERTGGGLLRHVIARVSEAHDEALVVVVATREALPREDEFVAMLRARVPEVVGVMVNENTRRTNVILGPRTRHVWGRDHIVEVVTVPPGPVGVQFRIGPSSFFQINRVGLEEIGRLVRHYLEPRPEDVVVDGYCGVGAISLLLASSVGRVIGIEEVDEAVRAARENVRLNDVHNAQFVTDRVERELVRIVARGEKVDAVVLDPPRKGCDIAVLETIAKLRVPRVVYVSCNPATLARDLALLAGMGYGADEIQPLDMFPQTSHVECVTRVRIST
ncbi:MAG: 23S rRNA (uracil(1939)-C(5))-methyltransferase RlmD [Armatimonadetes bacterium]|nr:23S rRNA (uracil(1939)-C(5))-methyltransferase RlmD [Armatimonadota bacterium]